MKYLTHILLILIVVMSVLIWRKHDNKSGLTGNESDRKSAGSVFINSFLNPDKLNFKAYNISEVAITGMKDEYIIHRDEDGNFTVGRVAENETVNQDAVKKILLALQELPIDSVYDSSLTDETIGLANPERVTVACYNGFIYQLAVGTVLDEFTNRAVRVTVRYQPSSPPERIQANVAADQSFVAVDGVDYTTARQQHREKTYIEMLAAHDAEQRSNEDEAKRLTQELEHQRYKIPARKIDAILPMKSSLINVETAPQ